MRSAAAKHKATLKMSVEDVATTLATARAMKMAIPEWSATTATGTVITAKVTNAVAAAMKGSQIIWRSCRNRSSDALRIAFPVGLLPAMVPAVRSS